MGPTYKSGECLNRKKIDNMTLIWLDKNISVNADNYYSMSKLGYLIHNIRTFSRIDQFLECLLNEITEEIILIVSGSFGSEIIPKIHNFRRIDSIYIFCQNLEKHRLWTKDFNKIQGVFNDIDFLCLHLRKEKLFKDYSNCDLIENKSLLNSFEFIEYLKEPNYQYEQDKKDFLFDYNGTECLSVSDVIDEDLNENIDSYLMYFSSNDNIERIHLENSVEHSNTVIPFTKQIDQKYLDNGTWPCLWWIIKNENNFSKMIGFNKIRHLIFHIKIIKNLEIYFNLINQNLNKEHFVVICDEDNIKEYLPKLCRQENVRRIYLHFKFDTLEQYQFLIKPFSKLISILQYSDTLTHMILHDFTYYLIKLGEHYQKENKNHFAKIRYEYALQLKSNIQTFIKEKIKFIDKH